jgi:hypothetical protein
MSLSESIILYGRNDGLNLKKAYEIAIGIIGQAGSRYILNNVHPDFLLVRKSDDENDISIEKARYINEFLSIRSDMSGRRIVIIEKAENMNKNTANALLKTLEEPPIGSVIIITTSRLFSILPTIRSRCQKVFINGPEDKGYQSDDPFFKKCIAFFDGSSSNLSSFAKSVGKDEVAKFIDIAMTYSYCRCLTSQTARNAERYLALSCLVERSRNTHLDPYNLVAACCSYLV